MPMCGRSRHTPAVAYEAMSPFGITWGHLGLLMLPVLIIVAAVLAVVRRRDLTRRVRVVPSATLAAGLWAFFTVGAPVAVPASGYPEGATCLNNAFGDTEALAVSWDSQCGRALARHLVLSGAPSLLMLGVAVWTAGRGVRRRGLRTTPA